MPGINLKIQSESWGGVDKSWIRTRNGLDRMKPIMVDMSTFLTNHIQNGVIPSGTALGKITATGFYGPYGTASATETKTIVVNATGGTWQLTIGGQTTANLQWNASAAAVRLAIEDLSNADPGDVIVSGGPGDPGGTKPYTIRFAGKLPVATTVTSPADNLTGVGTVTIATETPTAVPTDGREVFAGFLFENAKVDNLTQDLATCPDVASALFWTGDVVETHLPSFSGTTLGELDAAARTASKAQIEYWVA